VPATSLAERLSARIRRDGPLRFDAFHESALYDPEGGFFACGGRAGRRGDFLTSPEVGPLFGAVVARALDTWWGELGRPDRFTFVDAGAGPGTLARSVQHAAPACLRAGVLDHVAVEVTASQRALHPGGGSVSSSALMPDGPFDGVVLANELLDDLPFRLLVFDGGWREAHVDVTTGGRFVEVLAPIAEPPPFPLPDPVPLGARIPWQQQAAAWLADAVRRVRAGRVVVIDYVSDTARLAHRPWRDWLRTYRRHERGGHYLVEPGGQDITAEVALDELLATVGAPDAVRTQAQWLALHGIDELVEQGRRDWATGAGRADLAALEGRSRVREAEALTDPAGLGGFTVAEWVVSGPHGRRSRCGW
jgi:SAM-dependent MidA family methyltransferase